MDETKVYEEEEFFEGDELDLNELSWWERFKMSKLGRFIENHGDAIAIGLGGLCAFAGVCVAKGDGNKSIYTTTEDGDVYRIKAKKMKSVSTKKIMNKTMVEAKDYK